MIFDILTLFPAMFAGPLGSSILKRGMQAGLLGVRLHDIRDYAQDRHRTVDDYPYGGGAGMVMKPEPLFSAVEAVLALPDPAAGLFIHHPDAPIEVLVAGPEEGAVGSGQWAVGSGQSAENREQSSSAEPAAIDTRHPTTGDSVLSTQYSVLSTRPPVILMSPAGRVLDQRVAAGLARYSRLVLVCGHYEGIDERVREHLVDDELSIGDYVLTGGELAAMVVVDAVARLQPGVLAEGSASDESHTSGLLEYPHYTRPPEFRGWKIPDILASGHHANIAAWRRREALRRTLLRRPDMLAWAELSATERKWLEELQAELTPRQEDPARRD